MVEREIVRETRESDGGSNLLIGIIVVILIAAVIYFIANGSFTNAPADNNGSTDTIDVNVQTPDVTNPVDNNDGNTNGGSTDDNGGSTDTTNGGTDNGMTP